MRSESDNIEYDGNNYEIKTVYGDSGVTVDVVYADDTSRRIGWVDTLKRQACKKRFQIDPVDVLKLDAIHYIKNMTWEKYVQAREHVMKMKNSPAGDKSID
jgi:hypothetical protein